MFETPITSYSATERRQRKLVFKYVNLLTRKYEQLANVQELPNRNNNDTQHSLPTPDNSAAEASDADFHERADATNFRIRKRRRQRLQAVLGHRIANHNDPQYSGEESESDHSEEYDGSSSILDPEKKFYSKYYKPQETYEVWTSSRKHRVPIQRKQMGYYAYKKIQKYAHQRMVPQLSLSSKKLVAFFEMLQSGYEIYPRHELTNYQKIHLKHLVYLLYSHIYQEDWDTAYRCFSVLIRMELTDLRSIWNLGTRILENRTFDMHERFLEWMSTIYTTHGTFSQNSKHMNDPVFREGSRTHVPKYVLGWMWLVLEGAIKGKGSQTHHSISWLIDKLSDLLLRPPYVEDPEMWFIQAMCFLIQADDLSSQVQRSARLSDIRGSELDIARNRVIQTIQNVKTSLQTCREKGDFVFPETLIEEQLIEFEKRLYFSPSEVQSDENNDEEIQHESSLENEDVPQKFKVPPLDELAPTLEDEEAFTQQLVQFASGSDQDSSE